MNDTRGFQFRFGTLLIVLLWFALASAAVAMPTSFWAGVLLSATLLALLASVLVIIYREGRTRAFAVGFLVFASGYLLCTLMLNRSLRDFDNDLPIPTGRAAFWAYRQLHAHKRQTTTVYAGGNFSSAPAVSADGGTVTFGGSVAAPAPRVVAVPIYSFMDFVEIANSATAMLLGFVGGIMAQLLYLTKRSDSGQIGEVQR
jgi:hypothetical protein